MHYAQLCLEIFYRPTVDYIALAIPSDTGVGVLSMLYILP
eukprot:COSAG06_NODE_42930_length_377_cov_0.589928_1_plen_39_part_10